MSLGQTTSAPASTCETAVRASSSSDASLSTSSPRSTPQWPWAVYSQRQTSVSRSSSGKRGRSARSACWTIPSAIQAPEPSSSFSSGMPNRITALTPARSSSSHSRTTPSTVWRDIAGSALVAERLGRDEERHHEIVERERRLAHEIAQRARPAQPAEPGDRERAHRRKGTAIGATAGSAPATAPAPATRLDLDRDRPAARPRLERDPLGEELPDRACRRRAAAARSARRPARRCSLPASSPKITSSGCSRSALPITFGTTMWPSIWWIAEEEQHDPDHRERMDDERVDHRRDRAEPRARGTAAPRSARPTPPKSSA